MTLFVLGPQTWEPGQLAIPLADFAAHALPAGAAGITYFLPFLGLEFDAAFNDVPFRVGPSPHPQQLGALTLWSDGAPEPQTCRVVVTLNLNGLAVPGLSTTIDLQSFPGTGIVAVFAAPPITLATNDRLSVQLDTFDPTTGTPTLLFARVSVLV